MLKSIPEHCSVEQKNPEKKPLRVHIEGSIGAGKTSLLNFLKEKNIIDVYPEPLHEWQDLDGNNIFDLYYKNPEKYSFTFQSFVLLTLAKRNLCTSNKPVQVYERSIESVQNCFIKALLRMHDIDSSMNAVLQEYIEFLNQQFGEEADLIIYIRTTPSAVLERIAGRGRSEERGITEEYLLLLNKLYENWISKQKKGRVFVIDGNQKFEDLKTEYENCFTAIEQALYNRDLDGILTKTRNLRINSM